MNDIELKTIARDGKARLNEVTLNNKQFQTPLFMPVATRGALKSLPFNYLDDTDIILANTYHLYLRPGLEVIKEFENTTSKSVPYKLSDPRKGDTVAAYADVKKINNQLGWKAKFSLKEALQSAWNWEKELDKKS